MITSIWSWLSGHADGQVCPSAAYRDKPRNRPLRCNHRTVDSRDRPVPQRLGWSGSSCHEDVPPLLRQKWVVNLVLLRQRQNTT